MLMRFASSSEPPPAMSGWWRLRSARHAISIASNDASTGTSSRAYRSSAGMVTRGGTTVLPAPGSGRDGLGAPGVAGAARAAQERLDLLDRPGRALAGPALGDLDATGLQGSGAHRQDPRHAEQLGVGELHAGRFVTVVPEDVATGLGGELVEALRQLADLRV